MGCVVLSNHEDDGVTVTSRGQGIATGLREDDKLIHDSLCGVDRDASHGARDMTFQLLD